jgi:uncharacterized protein YydD (DUF2326 family)
MIHRVYSSLETFRELSFRQGLNILLSDKSAGSTQQHTRNRAGKSSLLELVHFVCGGNAGKDSLFRSDAIVAAHFGLEMDLFETAVQVSRSGSEPSRIVVEQGDTSKWPKQPKTPRATDKAIISNANWRLVLGKAFFGLTEELAADSEEEEAGGNLSFRSMLPYFARRERNGGMREPSKNNANQQTGNSQIALSYLIGFDWTIAQQWESVRQKEKRIKELKQIVGQGLLTDVLDSAASLRSRLVVAEEKLNRIVSSLSSFRVHEQYRDLEREATALTRELADIADENQLDHIYIDELNAAMSAETPPAPNDLARLYEEAGIVLPELVRRRYEDVVSFHESIVRNRRSYLRSELAQAAERVKDREQRRNERDSRRAALLGMLRSHGALDQFVALQAEQGRLQADVDTLRHRFEAATQLESTSSSLESDRVHLLERLRQEFSERSNVLDEAIRTFSRISDELYGEPGRIEFHPTHNGPEIRIDIPGDRSRGIGNMEIFCFDMMLQQMCARQGFGPGFLIHDSHLFDGVDPRQTGKALAVGATLAERNGFQYIVTLNSDVLSELPLDFEVRQYIIPQRLTDATDDGGLFGIRFDPPKGYGTDQQKSGGVERSRQSPS